LIAAGNNITKHMGQLRQQSELGLHSLEDFGHLPFVHSPQPECAIASIRDAMSAIIRGAAAYSTR
jgi:hypothetical protein